MFQASFHSVVTSRMSWYAPPDTAGIRFVTSCLRISAINRRCSLNLSGCTFLRVGLLYLPRPYRMHPNGFPGRGALDHCSITGNRSFWFSWVYIFSRVMSTQATSTKSSGVVLTVLARVLAAPLAKIFVGYDEGLFTLTCHAFRLFSYAFLFAGFNIFASSFFTALGNGLISAAISFLRTLVFQTSSVILLPLLLGVDGIWYAITAAEIFATLISIIFLLAKRRKYHYM